MIDDEAALPQERREQVLQLYDLLMTELGNAFTAEQTAVFGFTRHELRTGRRVPLGLIDDQLRILSDIAIADDRPDLARKVQSRLGPGADMSIYTGPPLTRTQLQGLLSHYEYAARELNGLPQVGRRIFYRLWNGDSLPDAFVVGGLQVLSDHAADQRRSDVVVRLLRAYLDLLPDDWHLWFNLGNHLAKLDDPQGAIGAYDQALQRGPEHAWPWFNRGRLHDDLGHHEQAMADWVEAAMRDCDLASFAHTITRRIIRAHGFVAMVGVIMTPDLPAAQIRKLTSAFRRALDDARAFDGWYLERPPWHAHQQGESFAALVVLAELADIRRASPSPAGFSFFARTSSGYEVREVDEAEVRDKLWYLPPGEPAAPPDRVDHLIRLGRMLQLGEATNATEAIWAVHYAIGAIALSCLMDGGNDWPSPVLRLVVPGRFSKTGYHLDERQLAAVVQWIEADTGSGATDYALTHLRAASETLKALSLATTAPDTMSVFDMDEMTRTTTAFVADPDGDHPLPSMQPGSVLRAESLWWYVEPVYREWVLAAWYGNRPAARLTALCHARQFNALAATELWADVDAQTWLACRAQILAAYDSDVSLADVQAGVGPDTMLLDYYTYEIFGETVSQLSITSSDVTIRTRDVDVAGGELRAMIEAGTPEVLLDAGFPALAGNPLELPGAPPRTLLLVPWGYLRGVPMHALPAVQDAIERGDVERVIYLPTVSAICRPGRPASPTRRALFVGYGADGAIGLDADLAALRGYADEVVTLTGEAATVAAVLAQLPGYDIVHFACHGDLDTRLAAGYLTLADGRLYPWHVLSGTMPQTVIMNACLGINVQRIETTSDGAIGLHDAFLVAGSRHAVGGLWELPDTTAREFATSLYAHLGEGLDVPASVIRAQQELRAATNNPFLWAPYACFGEWRS